MKRKEVLIVGNHSVAVVRLFNKQEGKWLAITAATDEEAIEKIQLYRFDGVVFLTDLEDTTKAKLRKILSLQIDEFVIINDNSDIDVVKEMEDALADLASKNSRFNMSYKDDALKNAGLNINIQ